MRKESQNNSSKKVVGCGNPAGKKNSDYQLSSNYLEQRLSDDGNSYVDISFENGIRIEKKIFECGKDGVTREWLLELDSLDDKMVGNEIQEGRLADFRFGRVDEENADIYIFLHSDRNQKSVYEQAFLEERPLSPKEQVVRNVVESLTPKQRFVYELRCDRTYPMSFPDIAELFTEYFGTPTSDDGVRNLYLKVCDKVCQSLGVPRPMKNKHN